MSKSSAVTGWALRALPLSRMSLSSFPAGAPRPEGGELPTDSATVEAPAARSELGHMVDQPSVLHGADALQKHTSPHAFPRLEKGQRGRWSLHCERPTPPSPQRRVA